MSSLGSPNPFFIAGKKAYEVDRSLKFYDSSSSDLSRTPSSTGNRKVWTFSAWIKLGHVDSGPNYIYSAHSGSDYFGLYFQSNELYTYFSPGNNYGSVSDREFRDIGAWFHLVHQVDAENTIQRIWINNEEMTLDSNRNPSNSNFPINQSGVAMKVGNATWRDDNVDSYMAEIHYSDGYKYAPTDFAETNAITGQWVPKSPSISYGTNGFYLNFSDNSGTTATTLGKDYSGNGNNFTPNNFVTGDAVKDSPTNNFCTYNPLNANKNIGQASFSEGNLRMTSTSGNRGFTAGTMKAQGKIYFEVLNKSNSGFVGISEIDRGTHQSLDFYQGTPRIDGSAQSGTGQFSSGDIMGVKVDIDAKSIEFFRNGSSVYSATYTTDVEYFPFIEDTSGGRSTDAIANFGQDSSFGGEKTAQGNTDANGKGDFYYSVPSGYLSLCSANLPEPTILLPNKHFDTKLWTGNGGTQTITGLNFSPDWVWIKIRTQAYNHVLWDTLRGATIRLQANQTTADGTNTNGLTAFNSDGYDLGDMNNINKSGDSFVGWNWNAGDTDGKTYAVTVVSDSGNKYRFDGFGTSAVTLDLAEGGTYVFDWSDSSAQSHPIRFSTTSDGTHGGGSEYTTGVVKDDSAYKTTITVAASAPTLYYYCQNHSGMGGQVNTNSTLGSSNFDGSRHVTTKANATAGFSIIKYRGTGSTITIGHGLGVVPQAIIVKTRDSADHWAIYHHTLGNGKIAYLNLTNTPASSSAYWNNTTPTSSVFTVGSDNKTNKSGDDYIAYCFSGVSQFSKFGEFEGNGNNDGPFIFCGFSPALIIYKNVDSAQDYIMFDPKRIHSGESLDYVEPNTADAEGYLAVDILSNGFKITHETNTKLNGSGNTYIYFAWAESPFKNARAR